MPRKMVSVHVRDVSHFTKALRSQLHDASDVPGHLALMNMVARAAGFANHQHLCAVQAPLGDQDAAALTDEFNNRLFERALKRFDAHGQLESWPARGSVQKLCLWGLWAMLPARLSLSEKEVNERLNRLHSFSDPATLRRNLVEAGLMRRAKDGSDYRRIECRPPAEARELVKHLIQRRGSVFAS